MVTTAQIMVLSELRVLCVWLGCQIGLLSGKHAHVITSAPFCSANVNVKHALHRKKFYNAGVQLIGLLEDMCSRQEVPFEMRDFAGHLYTLLTSLEGECFAVSKAHEYGRATDEELELSSIMLEVVQEMKRELARDSDRLKASLAWLCCMICQVRVIKRMLLATVAEATPQSEETQRCLGFFINSLGHPHLDRPCSLEKMWSWTIMTPLYEEDVLYPLESAALAKELGLKAKKMTDLLTEGDDSVSLMAFLKATFPDEWENFKERMKSIIPDINVKELSEIDFAPGNWLYEYRLELQMWASCRGQLLGRTANGMMRNEKALRVLAKLEHPMPPTMTDLEYQRWIDKLVCSRFEMLVTPQTYGKNRDSRDVRLKWLSKSMDLMLQRHPRCLKAAFLEKAEVDGMGTVEFSVLIKGRDPEDLNQLPHLDDQPVYEQYRVRLPQNRYSSRGVILGEGKPENQNHAVIFAHMEGIQAIDMNQDGYLCEWLKSRNLLAELQPSSRGDAYLFCDDDEKFTITSDMTGSELHSVVRSRQAGSVFTAIVGFREYIFSESAGALGRFAAATEYAFGTITQRTMTHPARVRLHYGHPDIFNKLFVMTRGGMSKATRLLHLTEDVFCGCNHTLRGARIRYKEYISCGKGRDMGFDSINGFNFKIAGGGGEWAISRESYRMGTRLDFFRLMSFYHAGVGFYVNSWFTFLAVYLNTYALLLFAWARATEIQAGALQNVYNVQQVRHAVRQSFVLQLGTLALIPYAGQLMLENGVVRTALTLFSQIATGSLLFYTFQQQTVAQSFAYDMKYGSGKYVGTGRGFNLVSLEFVKIFSLYCRSHLYMGFEMIYALTTLYLLRDCASCNMGALTWSTWLLAVTLLFSPLWFNPFSFDMGKASISHNYLVWRRWMDGDVDAVTGSNWYTWNSMQLEKVRNDGGNNTDVWLNHLGTLFTTTPYMLMALGSASRLDICLDIVVGDRFNRRIQAVCNPYVIFFMATSAIWFMVWLTITLRAYWINLANHKPWRIYKWFVTLGLVVFIIVFFVGISRFMTGSGFEAMLIVIYANWNLLVSFHKLATPMLSQHNNVRAFSDWFFYTVDSMIGYLMFILMALLAFIGVVGLLQMKLLFNETFSEQVKHAKIGRAMKEQKVGFDNSRGSQPVAAPSAAVPDRVVSAGTVASMAVSIRSINQSEHRYT
ncbi:1,3-beta-glucan synthase component-domain-containing protein [Haematococcus lacustris]